MMKKLYPIYKMKRGISFFPNILVLVILLILLTYKLYEKAGSLLDLISFSGILLFFITTLFIIIIKLENSLKIERIEIDTNSISIFRKNKNLKFSRSSKIYFYESGIKIDKLWMPFNNYKNAESLISEIEYELKRYNYHFEIKGQKSISRKRKLIRYFIILLISIILSVLSKSIMKYLTGL